MKTKAKEYWYANVELGTCYKITCVEIDYPRFDVNKLKGHKVNGNSPRGQKWTILILYDDIHEKREYAYSHLVSQLQKRLNDTMNSLNRALLDII